MSDEPDQKSVIPARSVRRLDQAAIVHCNSPDAEGGGRTLSVAPLMDGDRVAGLEIRCGCGAHAVVECVYTEEAES